MYIRIPVNTANHVRTLLAHHVRLRDQLSPTLWHKLKAQIKSESIRILIVRIVKYDIDEFVILLAELPFIIPPLDANGQRGRQTALRKVTTARMVRIRVQIQRQVHRVGLKAVARAWRTHHECNRPDVRKKE
jgi:hypothetical protein